MSKVFLSHSSQDKSLVRAVFDRLGPNVCEMDEYTFSAGPPSWTVILQSLDRCNIFALFATDQAAASTWVAKEVAEANKRLAAGSIKRVLVFISSWTDYENVVPRELRDLAVFVGFKKAATIARAIQRHLVDLATQEFRSSPHQAVFVGRDTELAELKSKILSPFKRVASISIAGPQYTGRFALLQRALTDIDPTMLFSEGPIRFSGTDSCINLALRIHAVTNDIIDQATIDKFKSLFNSDEPVLCSKSLYELIISLKEDKHYIVLSDDGGIIAADGGFSDLAAGLLKHAQAANYPAVVFITQRRPSTRSRIENTTTAFLDITALADEPARQYVLVRAGQSKLSLSRDNLDEIVEAGLGLPRNYDYIIERCRMYGIDVGLDDLSDVADMNLTSARTFLNTIKFSDGAKWLLQVLRIYPEIPGEFLPALFESTSAAARSCSELLDWHVITEADGIYSISKFLQNAIGRDMTYELPLERSKKLASLFLTVLTEYSSEGKIPISAVDAAGIATIESGSEGTWSSIFILPSHYIYLARYCYDRRQFARALKFAKSAAKSRSSLSRTAFMQACRIMGMSAARIGEQDDISSSIKLLNSVGDPSAVGWSAFIRGFSCRLDGKLQEAESAYLEAERRLPREYSLHREMALTYLLLRRREKALSYGEFALERAPTNPYVIDIVVKAILATNPNERSVELELKLADLLRRLNKYGSSEGFSFFQGRMAEKALAEANLADADRYADEAVRQTPEIAAVYLTRARVKLAMKDLKAARSNLRTAREKHQHATYRIAFFEQEIDRVEIEMLTREKRWKESIGVFRRLQTIGVNDLEQMKREIRTGIKFDTRNLSDDIRNF